MKEAGLSSPSLFVEHLFTQPVRPTASQRGKVGRRNSNARRQIAVRSRNFRGEQSAVEQRVVFAARDRGDALCFAHLAGGMGAGKESQRLAKILLDDFVISIHLENRD